jgi:phosphatidylserine/phosphatidylglycerophosphate/cardiolipin synthase-like enzyme
MKITRLHIAVLFLGFVSFQSLTHAQGTRESSPTWDVYFSPRGGATFAIQQALDIAKPSVLVQAYSFTSAPIAESLVRAHKRGIKIRVLLDKSQKTEKYSSADFLANAGISTKIDAAHACVPKRLYTLERYYSTSACRHAIAHNKVMIIDNETVITESFNFTKAAEENNAENLLVVRDKELASRYIENRQLHDHHSEPYRAGAERTGKSTSSKRPSRRTRSPKLQERSRKN